MANISNITLPNGDNYDIKDKVARTDVALNRTTLGTQCKNLIKPIYQTSTIQGVTFTVNSDNSVTANGTNNLSTSDANLKIFDEQLEPGTYTLTGAVSETFRLRLGTGSSNKFVGTDTGNGLAFTVSKKARYVILCQVPKSETADNVTFYPMLRYADIQDDTYEPYKPSLQEQINNFGTQQQLLCDYSCTSTSSVTIQITGLFSNYSAVMCIVKYSYGTTSITLPLKYIKSIGKSKEYSPVLDLGFRYVDDNNLLIGGADAAISSVKIINLY